MKNERPFFMQTNFESRTVLLALADKTFIVKVTHDNFVVDPCDEGYRYELYTEGKKVAKCYVTNSRPDSEQKSIYNKTGYNYVPDHYIGLTGIYCEFLVYDPFTKRAVVANNRDREYGAILLNFVIGDVVEYSNYIQEDLSILLDREDKPETLAFYQKFAAKYNCNKYKVQGYTPMIINNPQQQDIYTGTVLSDVYFKSNPQAEPQK